MLAVFAMVVGLAHVWLHDSGTLDTGHFDKSVAEDCLLSKMPLVGAVAATRGLAWLGALILFVAGIALEVGSTVFYGGIPRYMTYLVVTNPPDPWVPFAAGTVSGALTLVLSVLALQFGTRGAPLAQE